MAEFEIWDHKDKDWWELPQARPGNGAELFTDLISRLWCRLLHLCGTRVLFR